jgi:hypothetical protein
MTTANGYRTGFEQKLRRLGDRWRRVLDTSGDAGYPSASEADMALIDALVKRRWSDDEIWQALEQSPRLQDRIERKGERHARNLYNGEIAKARAIVVPFPADQPTRPAGGARTATRPREPREPTPISSRPAPTPETPTPWLPSTSSDSFVTKYVAYASQRTDAPPEAHELMAVGILSALVGPDVRLPIAATVNGWRLNLWTLYIVDSTVGRKSTVLDYAREILAACLDGMPFIEWESSPQGFIQRLQDRDGKTAVFLRDEYSGLLQSMNRGGHMSGMIQTLIRAYDGRVVENVRVRKKGASGKLEDDIDRVTDPYLVTIAASTRESFMQRATIDNVLDGFLARFIVVSGHADPKPMVKLTREILALRDQIIRQAQDFAQKASYLSDVDIPDDVMAAAWETEQRWIREADDEAHPGATAASYKRLSDSVLRVAALIAIDEGEAPRIELAHYRAALKMGERWRSHTRRIIDELGATEFQRNCDLIMETVIRHPKGMMRSDLYRRNRRLRKRDFDEAMQALEEQDRIETWTPDADGAGRPAVMVRPVGASP